MLTILLGFDDFSKSEFVAGLAEKNAIQPETFFDQENLPNADNLVQRDLFGKSKLFILKGLLKFYTKPQLLENFISSGNQIMFFEEKLDKRSSENKQLLALAGIIVKQFDLPHGKNLNEWIDKRAKFFKAQISPKATEALAVKLGRDEAKEIKAGGKIVSTEEVYNLWQADSELQKLIAFAGKREISVEDVGLLVADDREVEVYDLTNAIADNQKQRALSLLHDFLKKQSGSDEKNSVIQLNALLAEQFRNVAMVQNFMSDRMSDAEILDKTEWKSGRLFIMKKIAGRFTVQKILDLLTKLSALDDELKMGSTPPKVLLDLIVSQLLI
jgi:DNA polymerase III delta subunit